MLEILKLNIKEDAQKYNLILNTFELKNPYNLLEYYEIFCGGLNDLICFIYYCSDKNQIIIMPGYIKIVNIMGRIIDNYYDFYTPYGYTGPFFNNNVNKNEVISFWRNVDEWMKNNNVVSEFIRFNLFGNSIGYSGQLLPTMLNVKGKIIDKETQWINFEHKVRKNVKKAIRENLESKIFYNNIIEKDIKDFYDIYIDTMKRTQANDSFFFPFEGFLKFIQNNNFFSAICTIYLNNIPISSELLLVSNDSIFSFLGGTKEEYFHLRPNDYLKYEVINWARETGKKNYVLGGGYGYEDGIFKYKKSFFPDDVEPFITGRKIIDEKNYKFFVEFASKERIKNNMEELKMNDISYFPLYKKQN